MTRVTNRRCNTQPTQTLIRSRPARVTRRTRSRWGVVFFRIGCAAFPRAHETMNDTKDEFSQLLGPE